MTGETSAWLFGTETDPLPLVDPTEAARILGVARHSLACYRALNSGPAYYKFGRWIRYLPIDLDAWRTGHERFEGYGSLGVRCIDRALLDRAAAAHFLTVTRHCLSNYHASGGGPQVRHFGRRIYYTVGDLLRWAEAQRRCDPTQAIRGRPGC